MSMRFSGNWKVSVKSKSASFDQRVVIVGTTNNQDGTFPHATFGTKTLQGKFGIQIQYEKGGAWHDSLMRIGDVARSASALAVEIQSDDNVGCGDLDFNDLILEANRTIGDDEWCLWGQVKSYAGHCFNPCEFPKFVIDDLLCLIERLPPDIVREIGPLMPELPPIKFPFPPPPPPWDYRAIRVEFPPELAARLFQGRSPAVRRGAFRTPGGEVVSNPASEAYRAAAASPAMLPITPSWLPKCHIEPAPGLVIRVVEYDQPYGQSEGGPALEAGHRQVLGQVITDDWGFYLFCFKWVAGATGVGRPDIILQLIKYSDADVPAVTLESSLSWAVPNLFRKDFCVPKHLLETSTDGICDDTRVFQFVGNLPVTRIFAAAGAERGHVTTQPGDALNVDRAPFGGVLYLKGSFENFPSVEFYRVKYYTWDCPEGNISLTTLTTPLRYYNTDYEMVRVGPGPVILPGIPTAPADDVYPDMENNHAYTHWLGNHYKARIDTRFMKTGYLVLVIDGLDEKGNAVPGADDTLALRIDNVAPIPEIQAITAGAGSGAGCGLIQVQNRADSYPVTYRAVDREGHLQRHYIRMFKCHNNHIGGANYRHYDTPYQPSQPLFWHGTPDEADSDLAGWVTRELPAKGSFLADPETFAAVSIELWAESRTTDGRHERIHRPRYVEVIGVQYAPRVRIPTIAGPAEEAEPAG